MVGVCSYEISPLMHFQNRQHDGQNQRKKPTTTSVDGTANPQINHLHTDASMIHALIRNKHAGESLILISIITEIEISEP